MKKKKVNGSDSQHQPKKGKTLKKKSLHENAELPRGSEKSFLTADNFPIVGIGASAGGLTAFEAFFSGMPSDIDPDMAFVLVQHLAPDHKSILTELISRYTRMKVFEVEDGMVVHPNCAYIIPPNCDMAFLNGTLHLLEPSSPRGHRLPIDFFFNSLAQDQHEKAICIVLSGTGSDGTMGVRAIKSEGGMVMVQNPESTEYDGMPRSVIATGLVDYELPPAEMPIHLIAFAAYAFGTSPRPALTITPKIENALKKIFILLRAQTNHDFSQYKPNTINRRIERRMAVHQLKTINDYIVYLQNTPAEVEKLFRELLIGVTNFFRDPDAFHSLEELIIPKILSSKPAGGIVRVWSAGCSTGEEAYSIAILLQERMEMLKLNYKVQIFATDIDSMAIAAARSGLYPASIADDLSSERLARFFTAEPDNNAYRIHKGIRDLLVFSEQSVIKDPPFSKLDLISCRNLLIYMDWDLHRKLLPLFHYALNPGGLLFLGSSETVGNFDNLFRVLDRKAKIFQRKENFKSLQHIALGAFLPPMSAQADAVPHVIVHKVLPAKQPLRELTEQTLLQKVTPASALVNSRGDILYLHGRTGRYLEPAPGDAELNILKMAREGLHRELTIALHKAAAGNDIVSCPILRVKTNGEYTTVHVTILPVTPLPETVEGAPAVIPESSLFLVVLEEAKPLDPELVKQAALSVIAETGNDDINTKIYIATLKQELRAKEEYLQATNEQLGTSNEELKSSNEEMQSVNEELQSTNEELETSKEELQSVNEELDTVNAELQTKVLDLSRANNDMNNLLAGTGIGTIFVDHGLRILRFTPTASRIINLVLSDIGRPVGHIVSKLVGYNRLVEDVQAVLDNLVPQEVEVQTIAGTWYTMRILPYRTLDNVIEGAVITFVDITDMKLAKEKLSVSEIRYRRLFETAQVGIIILDAETGKIMNVNPFLIEMLGYSQEQFIEKAIWEIGLFKDIAANRENFLELQQKKYIRYEDMPLETADGRRIDVEFISSVYSVNNHKVIQCDIRDISERMRAEKKLTISEIRYRRLFETAQVGIIILDAETGKIMNVNPFLINMLGYSQEQFIEKAIWEIGLFKDIAANRENFLELQQKKYIRYEDLPLETADGRRIDVEFISSVYSVDNHKVIQCDIRDISERKRAEDALKLNETSLRTTQDLALVGGWDWDVNKQTMFWTKETYSLHDLKREEFVPGSMEHITRSLECYLTEDRPVIQAAFERCAKEGQPYDLEFQFISAKGRRLWIRTAAEPIFENGTIVRVIGFIMDISDRRSQNRVS